MTRLCTVCSHPQRGEIGLALMLHPASYRVIAGKYRLKMTSLQRHEEHHLGGSYRQSQELKMKLSADNLIDQLGKWEARMDDQYRKADAANDFGAVIGVTRAASELIGKMDHIGIERDQEQRLAALEAQVQAADKEDNDDGINPTAFESA